jgi:hypothetical protein
MHSLCKRRTTRTPRASPRLAAWREIAFSYMYRTVWIKCVVMITVVNLSVPTAMSPPPTLPQGYCPPRFRQPPRPCPVLNFSNAYGNNMVLQAGAHQPAVVWGFCPPDAKVTVAFAGERIEANVSLWLNRSTWSARLPPTAPTFTPQNITASCCGNATATLSNVLFGDVWVCSGAIATLSYFPYGLSNRGRAAPSHMYAQGRATWPTRSAHRPAGPTSPPRTREHTTVSTTLGRKTRKQRATVPSVCTNRAARAW